MNYWSKYLIKKIVHFTPLYHKFRRRIKRNIKPNISEVYRSIKNVPYYIEKGYCGMQFEKFPILRKSDVLGNERLFISKKISKKLLTRVQTSGSSGISLNFRKTIRNIIKEEAFISHAYSLIGKNLKIAVLRGNVPSSGIYEYKYRHLLLSSYHLSKQVVLEYLEIIKRYKINCLYVYPTSIHIFCKFLKDIRREQDVKLPNIKGILSSSEILSAEMKDEILELFPDSTLIDLYGQTEHVAFAIAINKGHYHFYESYSIVEYLDTGITNGKNKIMEIVGTNSRNLGMPLIRYGTADFVEIDEQGNIISILGRTNDFVVNSNKNIVPCNFVTRSKSLENVISFQYYQDAIGELVIRAKVTEKFTEHDCKLIDEDIVGCFQNLMQVKVEVVADFEKTRNGKHIRCIQKLDLKKFGF